MSNIKPYIKPYSERSFAVFGDTQNYRSYLLEWGGKFNPNLKADNQDVNSTERKPGWIFPNTKLELVTKKLPTLDGAAVETPGGIVNTTAPTAQITAASQPRSHVNGVVDKSEKFEKLEKLVSVLSSRLEAVEAELNAMRKLVGPTPTALPTTTTATKRKITAPAAEPEVTQEPEEEDEISTRMVSLMRRKK
jgi:hypothetical protein